MKKNLLVGLMCPVLALASVATPVFAAENPTETVVKYEVAEKGYLWSVPANVTFDNNKLTNSSDSDNVVSIYPADGTIQLANGTKVQITLHKTDIRNTDKENYYMKSADAESYIQYEVKKGNESVKKDKTDSTYDGTELLSYVAGNTTSDYTLLDDSNINKGLKQVITISTTKDYIDKALVTGPHSDTLTFTVNVQAPRIIAATFDDGTELTWDELKLAENGTKYEYDASAITDDSIGINAFQSCCRLTNVAIPASVTSIGDYAFDSCSNLTSVTIPEGVTSIGNYAFQYCNSLTSITIPNGVTSIGTFAFAECPNLQNIEIAGSVQNIPDSLFDGYSSSAEMWSLQNITLNEGIQKIGERAFYACMMTNQTNLYLPSTITEIGSEAFGWDIREANIFYAGTISDWNAIKFSKDVVFNHADGLYTIHCTDGDIVKS